ncbi:WecB/TagA/CpsF family glycosyltransferase [Acidobacteriota bacterium]
MQNELRKTLLNIPVDTCTLDELIETIESDFQSSKTKTIFAVNPEKIIYAQDDFELFSVLEEADFLIPDGIGIVIGFRLIYGEKISRITGIGTMQRLLSLSLQKKYRIFILGARPHVIEQAIEKIKMDYNGVNIVGTQHGYISEEEHDGLVERINKLGTDILFVGLGSPKQERWIHRHKNDLNTKICMGIGGSLDVLSNIVPGAPIWLQKIGMEWFYRLIKEPSRFNRQRALPKFAAQVIKQKFFPN